ncbi:MAG: helix-turn-helix transcriptional regulator [Negativicutes bacterium]|nr:helix-turn-helix transcriptional regulator [Negativicutes bacterium]
MDQDDLKFGEYVAKRRLDLGITLRGMADRLEITAAYLSDIEKGRRNPPDKTLLEKMTVELMITGDAKNLLFDLAGEGRKEVSADLPDYIMTSDVVRAALRTAKGVATEDDWQQFIKKLQEKGKRED